MLALVAVLAANSLYLAAITVTEWITGGTEQRLVYQWMFLGHLALGLLLIVPFLVFVAVHLPAALRRPNPTAVRRGYLLAGLSFLVLVSGVALTRFGVLELRHPTTREVVYWIHVLTPLAAVVAYVRHRRAAAGIVRRAAVAWTMSAAAAATLALAIHVAFGRSPTQEAPAVAHTAFAPSLSRTASGGPIPARALMIDGYCRDCHQDAHDRWSKSAHRFSSFNNPVYAASVRETRQVVLERDGTLQASRWCAGCHDPVPLFSGAFDRVDFDDRNDPVGQAGLTCTACHAITAVNSTRGNGDYTIEEPAHYPFAFSERPWLRYVSRQLIKAKPSFHRQTFLKPFHRSTEFCSTCHKVHIPEAVNAYKPFLRGQNHYDSFLLSGASGHGTRSFYYPDRAQPRCAGCHMPLRASSDFGARPFDDSGQLTIHDHLFAAANTGVAFLRGDTETVKEHQAFLKGVARVDVFGVREGGSIEGRLHGPIRPEVPVLQPGARYLLETVVRTLKIGHVFTQGTADSNEVWLELEATSGDRVIGESGKRDEDGTVDPWSYFLNVYMLDRHGRRIDRRNVQDIFVPLYDHQVPPSAATVVHYALNVPADVSKPVTVRARLQYRKFDRTFMRHVMGDEYRMDLPVTTIAEDVVTFPVSAQTVAGNGPPPAPEWERLNDYGIGLLLEGSAGSERGELRQAAEIFARVEALGRPDGPLNLARVLHKEGRVDEAAIALRRAAAAGAPPWTVAWLSGLVNKENGRLDEAIANFRAALGATSEDLRARGFDFSKDYEVINELGLALFERAKQERGADRAAARAGLLEEAAAAFEMTLALDVENVTAHYALSLIASDLGDPARAARHREAHARYKLDENARDRAIAAHRLSNPPANRAAQALVIYSLTREPSALAGQPADADRVTGASSAGPSARFR
jgi:Cytochrome c554 and c-prime